MENFAYHNPTRLYFGRQAIDELSDELEKYGQTILLVTGGGSVKRSMARYYILCAGQLAASALCVRGVSLLFSASAGWQSVIKIVIDTILFFVSFGIQRDWVYAGSKGDKK